MDPETIARLGRIGGLVVGFVVAVISILIGTYFMVKNINNTMSPRKRALVITASIIGTILIIAFVATMFLSAI